MLHGNGSTRHEAGNAYDYAAPEMAKAGIATIRFDYIGNGDSTSDYIDFTYDKGVEDAMKCYEYLATLGVIDMDHVGIMGWSQGGRLALLTAARNDVFTTVLTWAGAYDQKGGEQKQYEIAKKDGYYEVIYDWRAPLKQSPAYYECAMAIDYAAEVANIKAPHPGHQRQGGHHGAARDRAKDRRCFHQSGFQGAAAGRRGSYLLRVLRRRYRAQDPGAGYHRLVQ